MKSFLPALLECYRGHNVLVLIVSNYVIIVIMNRHIRVGACLHLSKKKKTDHHLIVRGKESTGTHCQLYTPYHILLAHKRTEFGELEDLETLVY